MTGIRNLWDAASQEVQLTEVDGGSDFDKYVLFMGGKSSGKTTAILKFLSRDESCKPTTGLEYTFARRATNLQNKMTGHIWELGGGTNLSKLLDIPLKIETLHQMTIILVLDLSEPSKLWHTAETLLSKASERLDQVIKQAAKRDSSLVQKITKAAWEKVGGRDRQDVNTIQPFPVPLVIIGSKYDQFQDTIEAEKRKVITKCLRYLAHSNGATLLYLSSKIDATVRGLRHVMNVAAFDGQLNKSPVIDGSRPIYVPAGMDSIDAIGSPPLSGSDVGRGGSRNPAETWRIAFCGHFPQEGAEVKRSDDPCKDPQFKEPKIDELRSQKDRELEVFKKQESQKWTARLN
uniref:Cytoplasmic dynein 2 light intermediate chain 1 n=1 Tax=Phallusia mammillata TaxID=59560 RepID=A0A6F9DC28_9ASCI|nr:cytoplasmic dynein 2 light intermediate chain 1-like [Phallusia mammillata]